MPEDIQCRQLTCEQIFIQKPYSPYKVEITAQDNGVGIWLTGEDGGPIICICHGFDQGAQVSIRSGRDTSGHDLSMNADKKTARVQVVGKETEQVIVIEASELYEILAHLHRGRVVDFVR